MNIPRSSWIWPKFPINICLYDLRKGFPRSNQSYDIEMVSLTISIEFLGIARNAFQISTKTDSKQVSKKEIPSHSICILSSLPEAPSKKKNWEGVPPPQVTPPHPLDLLSKKSFKKKLAAKMTQLQDMHTGPFSPTLCRLTCPVSLTGKRWEKNTRFCNKKSKHHQ